RARTDLRGDRDAVGSARTESELTVAKRPDGSMPAATFDRLELGDQAIRRFLAIRVQHARVVLIEQRIFDARKPGALAALDHDHLPGVDHIEYRHAVDRR